MTFAAGTEIGRYKILSKLGEGGMGEVYLAEDTRLRRNVALKILPAEVASDRVRMERFVQEAKAASALNHPNIITIYEIDQSESHHFIAIEYIDGQTLRERAANSSMTVSDALDIAIQATSALAEAHEAGIIHRDIKPDNIMIRRDGIVKVLDFGLAKLSEPQQSPVTVDSEAPTSINIKTEPGVVMGTYVYMSPEQARGLLVDARTDIFSFGVVLYEIVAGRLPFKGTDRLEVLSAILGDAQPPPLARYAPDAPDEFQRIVAKALAKPRESRYQSTNDLLNDLQNLKKRLELEAELERTLPPEGIPPPLRTAEMSAPPPTGAAGSITSATPQSAMPRVASGARSKLQKRTVVITAVLAALAVALGLLWYFKSGSGAPLTGEDTIVVADFINTTGDPVFDGTLKQALASQLEQSPFLSTFSDNRAREALRLMNRSPDERVTKDIAREICLRQNFKAFLTGSISNIGSHYVVTLEATNAHTGDTIALEQAEADSKEQVLAALGAAATNLRKQLGESLASIQKYDKPIHQATTSSLEALKSYSTGIDQQLKGRYLDAIPQFKKATEVDPNFARAYAAMSSMFYNTGQPDLAAEASRKAYELRDRVGERERLYIAQAYYDNVTGELEHYLETLEQWKRTYPRDAIPHNNLAVKYNDLGEFAKGAENAREAVRLNPNAASPHSLLAGSLMGLNQFDEAKGVITQAFLQKLENLRMHQNLYRIAFIQGDAAAMNREIEWARARPEGYSAQLWQAEAAAFSGQLRQAKELSKGAFEEAQRRDLKEVAAQISAGAALRDAYFGDCSKVKDQTAKAREVRSQLPAALAANALAICGESSESQTVLSELAKRFPSDTLLHRVRMPLIQAQLELERGNSARALELLETTKTYEGYLLFPVAYLRGQALLHLKRGNEAAAEFQKILDHRGWSAASHFYPLAHLGLARAAAQQGDSAKARKAYQDFLELWKGADANVSVLVEAKKEYDKLK